MRSVNIAELKNRLSAYLVEVRRGEEILIRDRQRPVAKIVPRSMAVDADEEEMALADQRSIGARRADRRIEEV
jgi:prevent-host-death family protein